MKSTALWQLGDSELERWLAAFDAAWEALAGLEEWMQAHARRSLAGTIHPSAVIEGEVLIEKGAVVEPFAFIAGPTIIKAGATVRQGAYIRGNVYLAEGAICGHATEAKKAIFLPGAGAPHFSYVGDSILGRDSNLGAGAKLSNFKVTKQPVRVRTEKGLVETGLLKFGALLGDESQLGCNVVLSPGTIVGPRTLVYLAVPGAEILPADSLIKLNLGRKVRPRR